MSKIGQAEILTSTQVIVRTNSTAIYFTDQQKFDTMSSSSSALFGLCLLILALLSHFPANLIHGYIKAKPIGMQRLVDFIYADVSR